MWMTILSLCMIRLERSYREIETRASELRERLKGLDVDTVKQDVEQLRRENDALAKKISR